jgi:hypothetical protein
MGIVRAILARLQAAFAWWLADIQRRPSLIGKAASLFVGLIVICCVCSVGLGAVRGTGQAVGLVATNTPSPLPTNTPAPTATPEATHTPLPTATLEATHTPEPTPTLAATAAPVPTIAPTEPPAVAANKLTVEERQAVTSIGEHLSKIGTALGEIGKLSQNYENSDDWKISMAAQIVTVQLEHQALLKLDVPPKVGALHAAILKATSDCDAAMTKMISGLDKNSAADLRKATALMQSCGQKIQDAKPELDALSEQT